MAAGEDEEEEDKKNGREGDRKKASEEGAKGKNGLGLGFGLGGSTSSRKPPWQMGQEISAALGARATVRSHWWQ